MELNGLTLDGRILLAASRFAAPRTEARMFLTGVHVSAIGDVVGCNGHAMFVAPRAAHWAADAPAGGILIRPVKPLPTALRKQDRLHVKLEGGNADFGGCLCEVYEQGQGAMMGEYVDWMRVMPSGEPTPDGSLCLSMGSKTVGEAISKAVADLTPARNLNSGVEFYTLHNPDEGPKWGNGAHARSTAKLLRFGVRRDCFGIVMPVLPSDSESAAFLSWHKEITEARRGNA